MSGDPVLFYDNATEKLAPVAIDPDGFGGVEIHYGGGKYVAVEIRNDVLRVVHVDEGCSVRELMLDTVAHWPAPTDSARVVRFGADQWMVHVPHWSSANGVWQIVAELSEALEMASVLKREGWPHAAR